MAYSGSTASTPNPPVPVGGTLTRGTTALTGAGITIWAYKSTNLTTDIVASGFFSDGANIGMKAGDVVMGTQYTSAGSSVITFQGSIASISTAGAASLSTGGTMTSTFA